LDSSVAGSGSNRRQRFLARDTVGDSEHSKIYNLKTAAAASGTEAQNVF